MKKLSVFFRPFLFMIISGIFLKAVGTVADLGLPYLLSLVIDNGIANHDVPLIVKLCAAMLAITLASFVFNLAAHYFASYSSQKIGQSIRNSLYDHLQGVPISDVERFSTSSLITRTTNDVDRIQNFISTSMRMMVRAPILAIGGVIMSLLLDPYLTIVIFIAMVLIGGASIFVYRLTRPIYRKVQIGIDKMTAVVRENLFGIRVVKSFDKCDYECKRFSDHSGTIRNSEIKAGKISAGLSPSITIISNIAIVIVLFISAHRIESGYLEIGKVVTIVNYINMILNAMVTIPRIFIVFSRSHVSAGRINEVLSIPYEKNPLRLEEKEDTSTSVAQEAICFKNVSFGYPQTEISHQNYNILKNITFTVNKGETVAIIGPTGCGKSTLLYLLTRIYRPDSGTIFVDGKDLNLYPEETLRKTVSIALQQYNIFSMSIADNITLGNDYDEDKLENVADIAQISTILDAKKDRYDSAVSQYGSNLSGGQKQRINIARALYQDTEILILDDVSSALDYKTDLQLRKKLKGIQQRDQNKTILMIAQRISTIQDADKIIVMNDGEIVGEGRHEELLKSCQTYIDIYRTQTEVYA